MYINEYTNSTRHSDVTVSQTSWMPQSCRVASLRESRWKLIKSAHRERCERAAQQPKVRESTYLSCRYIFNIEFNTIQIDWLSSFFWVDLFVFLFYYYSMLLSRFWLDRLAPSTASNDKCRLIHVWFDEILNISSSQRLMQLESHSTSISPDLGYSNNSSSSRGKDIWDRVGREFLKIYSNAPPSGAPTTDQTSETGLKNWKIKME